MIVRAGVRERVPRVVSWRFSARRAQLCKELGTHTHRGSQRSSLRSVALGIASQLADEQAGAATGEESEASGGEDSREAEGPSAVARSGSSEAKERYAI